MTNREAIEYIERECHTCKGFYAPENECIAVPQDCFESKRLAISALQEREERERGIEMTNKDVPDEVKIAYDENGSPYMLEAFGSEAEHINRLLSAEYINDLISRSKLLNKLNDMGGCGADKNSWDDGWDKAIDDVYKFVESEPAYTNIGDDKAEYINNAIETER